MYIFLIISVIFSQASFDSRISSRDLNKFTGENYVTGEDGIVRVYVNVIGHVKYPGTYLVNEDIDLLTLVSLAGGPLTGAQLSKVEVINKSSNIKKIVDLNDSVSLDNLNIDPFSTIYIKESLSHLVITRTNLLSVFLQFAILLKP